MESPQQLTVYRGCTPIVDAEYRGESDSSPGEAVIDAIAKAADVDPLELPPLYEFVDADAIDNLVDRHDGGNPNTLLSFEVETWNVFVRADGRIRVCDGTQPTDPEPVFGTSVA
jgi:hypothetical protein